MSQQKVFHLRFGEENKISYLKKFIKEILEPAGCTMIILEIDKNFVYENHPEINEGPHSLNREDAYDLQTYARKCGIEIVPLFQCLGHQGWGGSRSALLRAYPEFDETPNVPLDAEWPEIFCRSWCPQHPDVNAIVFELMDEMIEAFDAKYFHIGLDEVYEIASEQCDRCRGENRAKLFAKTINDMYNFLHLKKGLTVMMWGDRLLDAKEFGYDKWEADTFGTYKAIDNIPNTIIICDWHYDERDNGFKSPSYFMEKGFRVLPACWFKTNVAEELFNQAEKSANEKDKKGELFGKLITSWNEWNEEAFDLFFSLKKGQKKHSDKDLVQLYHTLHETKVK